MHELYMSRCIELARLGAGKVSPNPMVGAVVVFEGRIIGEGWHEVYGQAHAEVNAINQVISSMPGYQEVFKKSKIYVSLEPCAHHGKTPPCSDLIIFHGIPEVIIGCTDSFSKVAGKGIEKLKAAGIAVILNILEKECRELNKRFFTAIEKHRPYVILKWAETANGSMNSGDDSPYWISSGLSRMLVHRWRTEEDAILVGKRTVLADDPELTSRFWPGKNPLRLVVDWNLELPSSLKIFNNTAPTYIFNGVRADKQEHLRWIELEFREYLPQYILYQLFMMDIHSLIIEGGKNLLEQFIKAGLWDEARIFSSDTEFQNGLEAPQLNGRTYSDERLGTDRLRTVVPF